MNRVSKARDLTSQLARLTSDHLNHFKAREGRNMADDLKDGGALSNLTVAILTARPFSFSSIKTFLSSFFD